MRSHKLATVIAGILLCGLLLVAQQQNAPLTNDDIVTMVKGGLQETTIISAIGVSETQFDVSVKGLLALKQAGIADKIIDAMLAAEAKKKNPPPPSATATQNPPTTESMPQGAPNVAMAQTFAQMGISPQMMAQMPAAQRVQIMAAMSQMRGMNGMAGMNMMGMDGLDDMPGMGSPMLSAAMMPKIALLIGAEKKPMVSSMAQMAESQTKGMPGSGPGAGSMLSSFATQGLSFAAIGGGGMFAAPALGIATGMLGGFGHHGMPKVTYIWALPGRNSAHQMSTPAPKFELEFGDIVGLDPDGYEPLLVHLIQTKDNWRLVGATKQKMDYMGSGSPQSMIDEERTLVKITRLARGHLQIEAAAPLTPGEYGLVLRPTRKNKPKKGESQSEAEQGVFYSVWDFSLPGEVNEAAKK